MPLPGLIESVSVELTPVGRRLADAATGAVLPLCETELRLLERWDGTASASDLAAKARSAGVDVSPRQVEAFYARMARIGVLDRPPPTAPDAPARAVGLKGEQDVVPTFREDLRLEPAEDVRGILHVVDPRKQVSFTLYDFEVSVARMLNGQRMARDVIAAAQRIGVSMTVASLRSFAEQLAAFGFLDAAPSQSRNAWKPRRVWSTEVRDLYQQALKLARKGERTSAVACLDSMLELDASNDEAMALRARLNDTAGRPAIGTSFELLHTKNAPELAAPTTKPDYPLAHWDSDPFDLLEPAGPPAEAAGSAAPGEPKVATPGGWQADVSEALSSESLSFSQRQHAVGKRAFWRILALAGVVILALVGLLFPVPSFADRSCTLEVMELAVLRAPGEGTVSFTVKSGETITEGQVVGRVVRRVMPGLSVAELEAKLAEANQRKTKVGATFSPAKVARAQKRVAVAKAQLDAAVAQRAKAAAQRGPAAAKRLAAMDKFVKGKAQSLERERADLEDAMHPPTLEGVEQTIADLKQQLEQTRAGAGSTDLVAEHAGRLMIEPQPVGTLAGDAAQDSVARGAVVARIIGSALRVSLPRTEGAPLTGHPVVTVGGRTLAANLDSASRLSIEGDSSLVGKPCMVRVPEGRRAWVLTLLK